MKLRITGASGLFDATLLVDGPDCSQCGHPAVIRIKWLDGEEVFASPEVAIQRCQLAWATAEEKTALAAHRFLPDATPDNASSSDVN